MKGRLALDKVADYLEELRACSRSRALSVALLTAPADTDPDDITSQQEV